MKGSDPLLVNTLDEAAVACHEMFMAYVRAGFNEDQALRLVIAWVTKTAGGSNAATS